MLLFQVVFVVVVLVGASVYVRYMLSLREKKGSASEEHKESESNVAVPRLPKLNAKKEKDAFLSLAETMRKRKEGEDQ